MILCCERASSASTPATGRLWGALCVTCGPGWTLTAVSPFRVLMPATDEHSRWEGILERKVLLRWRPQSHRTPPSFGHLKEQTPHQQRNPVEQGKHSERCLRLSSPQSPPHLSIYLLESSQAQNRTVFLSPSPPLSASLSVSSAPRRGMAEPPRMVVRVVHCSKVPGCGGGSRLKASSLSAHSHQAEQPSQQAFS